MKLIDFVWESSQLRKIAAPVAVHGFNKKSLEAATAAGASLFPVAVTGAIIYQLGPLESSLLATASVLETLNAPTASLPVQTLAAENQCA